MKNCLNKNIIAVSVLAISFFANACQGQPTSSNFNKKSKIEIEVKYSQSIKGFDFISTDGKSLTCWSPYRNIIKKIDLNKRTFYDEYETQIKNPKNYSDIVNIGKDSFALFSLHDNYSMIFINHKGNVLKKIDLSPKNSKNIKLCSKKGHPTCNLEGTGMNSVVDNYFYFSAYKMGEDRNPGKFFSGGKINVKTGEFEYFTEFPQIYKDYNWGAIRYYFPYFTSNDNNQIVVSYPASHDLFVYDIKKNTRKIIKSGSSLFNKIEPYSNKKELVLELKNEYIKYYDTNYAYDGITYDRKRKLYYRIALFPIANYGNSSNIIRKKSLIVLDENFKFIGEVFLPNNKNYYKLLATNHGIVIQYFDFNNNERGFTLFKVNML